MRTGLWVLLGGMISAASPAQAIDAAAVRMLGFSKDGRHAAYEQFGIQRIGGFPYSEIRFIDVPGNAEAGEAVAVILKEGDGPQLSTARKIALDRSQPTLASLGIAIHNTGSHVISHPVTDLGVPRDRARFSVTMPIGDARKQDYELVLIEQADESCPGEEASAVEVRLTNHLTGETKVLHPVARRPTGAPRCVKRYRIQDVFVYDQDKIVVLLNAFTSATDGGEAMRYATVSGILN